MSEIQKKSQDQSHIDPPNRSLIESLTQDEPYDHSNRTIGLLTAPLSSQYTYTSKLYSLGLRAATELPKSFDWRKQKGVELCPIINQGKCGSCWSVSSTSSFCDRWIIAKGKNGLVFDPLPTIVCSEGNKCGGGLPEKCQYFFESIGASPSTAYMEHKDPQPLRGNDCPTWTDYCTEDNQCCPGCSEINSSSYPNMTCSSLKCPGGFKAKEGQMHSSTVVDEGGVINKQATINSIKTDIMLHGPVVGKYQVFGDFMVADSGLVVNPGKDDVFNWKSTNGVYINGSYDKDLSKAFKGLAKSVRDGDPTKLSILEKGLMPSTSNSGETVGISPSKIVMGFHAIEIVGWDIDEKYGEYWIVKNSWGKKWNGDGYFKFAINNDGKTNANCGMDIPINTENGLFGGTVSFLPDIQNAPDWKGSSNSGPKGILGSSNPKKFNVKGILIVLAIIVGSAAIIGILIYFLKHHTPRGVETSYIPGPTPVKSVSVSQGNSKGVVPVSYSP